MCFLGGGLIMGVGLLVLLLPLSGGWVVKSPRAFSAVLYGKLDTEAEHLVVREQRPACRYTAPRPWLESVGG